jgi:hypothetical protein
MDYTPRESTIPNEYQLEQLAARYADLHPDGPPAKRHRLARLFRRALPGADRDQESDAKSEPHA